jgi:hypothetical protein
VNTLTLDLSPTDLKIKISHLQVIANFSIDPHVIQGLQGSNDWTSFFVDNVTVTLTSESLIGVHLVSFREQKYNNE